MVLDLNEDGLFAKKDRQIDTESFRLTKVNIIETAGSPPTDYTEGTLIINTGDNRLYIMTNTTTETPDVAYWKFNETSGNAADSSGNSHTATNVNTVDYVAGKYANCADFNGTDEYFTVGSHADFDFATNFTIEMWVRFGALQNKQIFTRNKDAGNSVQIWIEGTDYIQFVIKEGASTNSTLNLSQNLFVINTWYHLTFIADRTNSQLRAYINGNLVTTASYVTDAITWTGEGLYIGANPTPSYHFNGKIDELKIWNKIRNETEIKNDMSRGGEKIPQWLHVDLTP